MNIHKDIVGEVAVLMPDGRIDSQTAATFEAALVGALESHQSLILDFSEVPYISSAGLRVVLIGAKRLMASKGKFALCGLSESVLDVFKLSGFANILKISDDRDGAISELSG